MVSFQRDISIKINSIADERFGVKAHLQDPYHDILLSYEVTLPDFTMSSVQLTMERTPVDLCSNACELAQTFEGTTITKGFNQKVINTAGGPMGCVNLLNLLVLSAPLTINNSWSYYMQKNPMPQDQQDTMRLNAMKGKCLAYPE
ncbi:MAG: DUF2889 domain-containing protein [Bacillota bacterium]